MSVEYVGDHTTSTTTESPPKQEIPAELTATRLAVIDKETSKLEIVEDPLGMEFRCRFCGSSDPVVRTTSRKWQYVVAAGLFLLCFPLAIVAVGDHWCEVTEYRCGKCHKVQRKDCC